MEKDELKAKVRQVILNAFEITDPLLDLRLDTESIERWDSLGHLALIENIESIFKVSLTHAEIVRMLDEDAIVDVLASKI